MNDFKVGDRVVLIDDEEYDFIIDGVNKGDLGTIVEYNERAFESCCFKVAWDGRVDEPVTTRTDRLALSPLMTQPTEAYPLFADAIRNFSTGAVRDTADGKPRMGLLPLDLLRRVAMHYTKGADKYGADNWRLGQPKDTTIDSLLRHLEAYRRGETDEDHLSAVIWNAFSMMHVDENLLREHPELDFGYLYPKKEVN